MATKKIEIIYDINGKPIDLAINKTLNLQQQVKALTAELRKTKEGTAEFALLSTRLNDARDNLDRVNVKSKDLFATLSLLPGPIGQFFGQLNGAIGLLKTFSGFSLKDVSNQFKEVTNDVKDIIRNLLGMNASKAAIDGVSESSNDLKNNLANTAAQAAATGGALGKTNTVLEQQKNEIQFNIDAFREKLLQDKAVAQMSEQVGNTIENTTTSVNQQTSSTKQATVATEGLVVAEKQATFWTTTLGKTIQAALIATGIGLAVIAIVELVSWLYKLSQGEEEAEQATKSLTEALEEQQRVLQNDLDAIEMSTKLYELRAKVAGKSEEEISKISIKGGEERLATLRKNDDELYKLQREATFNTKITEEQRAKLLEDINAKILKNGQDITKQILSNEQLRLSEQLRIAESGRTQRKKIDEDILNDTKRANDLLLKLQQENSILRLKTERERQDRQLAIDKENEEKEISKLKIREELKGKLLEQIRVKYGLKVLELNRKRQEEDIKLYDDGQKALLEYQNKVRAIMDNAFTDELSRAKAQRLTKFEQDKADLEKDANFQKETTENKIRILLELERQYSRDIKKLEEDDRKSKNQSMIERMDEELKFLQIRNEGITRGTIEFYNSQREILDKSLQRELAALDLTEDQKTKIKKKYAQLRKDIDRQELNAYLQYATAILSAASSIFSQISENNQMRQELDLKRAKGNAEQEDKIRREYFEKNKKTQIAQAIIGTLQAAVQAFQSLAVIPIVGPALGAAAAAAALVFGYQKVNLIKQQQYESPNEGLSDSKPAMMNYGRNYGDGGVIEGPRHAQGGVPIVAEGGEAIMTRGSVAMFAPLLSAMNQMGGGTAFTRGAVGQARPDNPKVTDNAEPLIMKTYVVENELTSLQNKQARLKDLSTL